MNNRNILYMEKWIKNKSIVKNLQTLSDSVAAMKATTDFCNGVIDNCHPKHSPESHAYMKKYNELVKKHEH